MSVHCEVETLSAWLDDALPPAEAERVATHLAECPRCSEETAGLRRVAESLRTLERAAPPPVLAFEVGRRVALERRPASRLAERLAEGRQAIQPSVGLVFAIVFALSLIAWFETQRPSRSGSGLIPVQLGDTAAERETPAVGEEVTVAGRALRWDGAAWVEPGVAPAGARRVLLGSPQWRRWLRAEPRLAELEALAAPVVLQRAGEVVRLEPAP